MCTGGFARLRIGDGLFRLGLIDVLCSDTRGEAFGIGEPGEKQVYGSSFPFCSFLSVIYSGHENYTNSDRLAMNLLHTICLIVQFSRNKI